jgi:hypothetical protein
LRIYVTNSCVLREQDEFNPHVEGGDAIQ